MAFSIKLSDGKQIPAIGWGNGTGGLSRSGQTAVDIGVAALRAGILHIDTAQGYGTEAETRKAVEESGLGRDKVWITTKLSPMENGKGSFQPGHRELDMKTTPESIKANVERALGLLGGPPDLLLIHTPWVPEKGKIGEFWTILEGLVKDGTLRGTSLGVSNFRPADLRDVLKVATIKPVCHQLEYHPYVLAHLDEVQAIHDEHNIVVEAYGPLTPILRHPGGPLKPILERLAKKYKTETASILLRWTIQKNVVAVTTSTNTSRLASLPGVYDLSLTSEEMAEIEEAGRKVHFRHYDEHMSTDYPAPNLPDGK